MKILKFRVWDNLQQKFEYFELGNITVPDRLLSQDAYPVQQFIGVYDRDKREIYEGDIVRYKYLLHEHEVDCTEGEVFFEDGIFFFDRSMEWATNDTCFLEDSLEIVGNIFTGKEQNDN